MEERFGRAFIREELERIGLFEANGPRLLSSVAFITSLNFIQP